METGLNQLTAEFRSLTRTSAIEASEAYLVNAEELMKQIPGLQKPNSQVLPVVMAAATLSIAFATLAAVLPVEVESGPV